MIAEPDDLDDARLAAEAKGREQILEELAHARRMIPELDDLDDVKIVVLSTIIGALTLALVAVVFWSF